MFCDNSQQNGIVLHNCNKYATKMHASHTARNRDREGESQKERADERERARESARESAGESQREPERARKSQRFSQSSQSLVLSVMRYTNHTSRFLVLTKVPQQLRLIVLTQLTQSTQQLTEQTSKSNNCTSKCANNCTNNAEEVPREI